MQAGTTAFCRMVAAAAVLAAAAPGTAGAAFNPALAVTPGGTAHMAWHQSDGRNFMVQERQMNPAGALGPAQYVSVIGQDTEPPRIDADSSGNAIIAWVGIAGGVPQVYTRKRGADGSLGRVQLVSPAGFAADQVDVAVDGAGNATFVWRRAAGAQSGVRARRRLADGTLTTVQTISSTGEIESPRVGVSTSGNAVVAWRYKPADGEYAMQARSRSATGALGAVQTLTIGGEVTEHDLAVAPDGRASFAWQRDTNDFGPTLQGRVRAADGTLSPTQTLAPAGGTAEEVETAINADGLAVFAWQRVTIDPNHFYIEGRARFPSGGLGVVLPLGDGAQGDEPAVALDAQGNAAFVWASDANQGGPMRIQTRRRTAAGSLRPTASVSTPGVFAFSPLVEVDADGDAVLVWRETADGASPVRARRRTPSGALTPIRTVAD